MFAVVVGGFAFTLVAKVGKVVIAADNVVAEPAPDVVDCSNLLVEIDAGIDAVDAGIDAVDAGFDAVDAGFDAVDAGIDAVDPGIDAVDPGFVVAASAVLVNNVVKFVAADVMCDVVNASNVVSEASEAVVNVASRICVVAPEAVAVDAGSDVVEASSVVGALFVLGVTTAAGVVFADVSNSLLPCI
jgi:hypothetical protein